MDDNPQSYSKRVAVLKKLLPALAFGGFVALIIGSNSDVFSRLSQSANLDISGNLAINQLQFEGRLANGQMYQLKAERGSQQDSGAIAFTAMQLRIGQLNGGDITVAAQQGTMSQDRTAARLVGAVRMQDNGANQLDTDVLRFDTISGHMTAPGRITMQGPSGDLNAASLEIDSVNGIYYFDMVDMQLMRGPK